jgi:hypothetical protein
MGTNGSLSGPASPGSRTMLQRTAVSFCLTERDWRCINYVLKLELISFKAQLHNQTTQLNWTMVSGEKVNRIIVQRSNDGISFTDIQSVQGKPGETNSYQTTDDIGNTNSSILYYRLSFIMENGIMKFSSTISLQIENKKAIDVRINPNPVRNQLQVFVSAQSLSNAKLFIVDGNGKMIKTYTEKLLPGVNKFIYNEVSNFPQGLYFLQVEIGEVIVTQKFSLIK